MKQIILCMVLFLEVHVNSYGNDFRMIHSVKTVSGIFMLLENNNDLLKYIKLNNKTILKREIGFLWFEKCFEFDGHTIIVVGSDYSPSGRPSYQIFDIPKDGKVTYTKEVTSMDYTFKVYKIGSKSIEIDLGFEKGKRNIFIYKNGRLE